MRNHIDTVRYVTPQQTTDECMALKTENRIRYLPVIVAGEVIGKVSIGDLVKNLIAEQETLQQLVRYIHGNGFQRSHIELKMRSAASSISQLYQTRDDESTANRQKRLLMFKQFINQVRHAAGAIAHRTAAFGLAGLLALGAIASNDAEAKRVGGSESIGRQTQAAPQSGQAQRSQQAQPAQQAAQSPAAAAGNRWMGPLAGLAAGLGIAALLSSFGLGGELAQMLSNALLIGLVVFCGMLLYRFIANRRRPDLAYGPGAASRQQTKGSPFRNRIGQQRPEANPEGWGRPAVGAAAAAGAATAADLSSKVDLAALLVSAKDMFMLLQGAWDRNEQGDMFELTTPEMFMRLKQDLEARGRERSVTEVTRLDAEVLSTEGNADETLVSVHFHGQMREDDNPSPEPFQEIWNLVKRTHGDQTWRLAGIQQITV
ncbi:hypothetical protein BSFA1_76660 (plasmid) [Burkholderia sp. SFA1]|nr:hypothetical protein BSFA1_76400 [Burkholderia sp. SFA1]BBQ02538.1 hypothetical protein BSFA1_76660 [Burkholderia sp. SFA1]